MAARARSEPQWRSKLPLEPDSEPLGRSESLLKPASEPLGRSKWPFESPVGVAGALEMAARAPSASLGRSKWPHEPARLRRGGRNRCSGPLGFAEALTLAARVRSAPLGRSKWPLELARLRWGGRNRCSGLLSRPRWGARQRCSSFMRKSYSKTLCSGRDSLWTPGSVRLSSEHGYARVRASNISNNYTYLADANIGFLHGGWTRLFKSMGVVFENIKQPVALPKRDAELLDI